MTIQQSLSSYLKQGSIMQVATSRNNNPWVVSVFYVVDDEYNFYWLSLPTRRHSEEISDNNRAAITIAIKQDLPVIGIYAEGTVAVSEDQSEVKMVARAYVKKHNAAHTFYDRFVKGIHQHHVYKLSPVSVTLFDEHGNPDNPIQTLCLT